MLTEEAIRQHFQHNCNAGMDPLLCVHRIWHIIDPESVKDNKPRFKKSHRWFHVDKVIDEDRYVELIQKAGFAELNDLSDVDMVPANAWLPENGAYFEEAGIFWLYPSGCRTLTQLFKKYEAKIKIILCNDPEM